MKNFVRLLAVLCVMFACLFVLHSAALADNPTDKPAAKLSIQLDDDTPVSLSDNEALNGQTESKAGQLWSLATNEFENSYRSSPMIWNIAIMIMGFFGMKAGSKKTGSLISQIYSSNAAMEIFGVLLAIVGGFCVLNAVAYAASWEYLTPNLILGGIIAVIFGIGIACDANEQRNNKNK